MKSSQSRPQNNKRRRILRILAATSVAGLAAVAGRLMGKQDATVHTWQGNALGADSTILIYHPDRAEAARLNALALNEIERLEKIFSLMRPDSMLVKLNREKSLENPPAELTSLLFRAQVWSELTGGDFDVTVQPLWELYSSYFSDSAHHSDGPSPALISKARRLVNYRGLDISRERISLTRPGMAITLNGIAQGEITERVAMLLRTEGLQNSLIDLGEMRALGSHPDSRPWRVGIRDPYDVTSLLGKIDLRDRAVATSSITGTVFDHSGQHHHLFNPHSGRPNHGLVSASVVARRATDADALSTALLAAQMPISPEIFPRMGIEQVLTIDKTGSVSSWVADA